MSWEEIDPVPLRGTDRNSPVGIGCTLGTGQTRPAIYVMLKPCPALGWPLQEGARLSVLVGTGGDAGRLRLHPKPNGAHVLRPRGPKHPGGQSMIVRLPAPDGWQGVAKKRQDVTFRRVGDVLELDLPPWFPARKEAAAPVAAVAAAVTAPPAEKAATLREPVRVGPRVVAQYARENGLTFEGDPTRVNEFRRRQRLPEFIVEGK